MTQISAHERALLLKQGNASRALYRSIIALAPAALFVVTVVAGFVVLGG